MAHDDSVNSGDCSISQHRSVLPTPTSQHNTDRQHQSLMVMWVNILRNIKLTNKKSTFIRKAS